MTRSWRGMRARAYKVESADRGVRVGGIRLKRLKLRALMLSCLQQTRGWSAQFQLRVPERYAENVRRKTLRNVREDIQRREIHSFAYMVRTS